eukprot:CAMPEP_0198216864 /NCGR_PEP_ID=MMETSP1445-20131203/60036_1 /TAXON_ID=36898 /ORGANISM="Pyramimonas sp., Strain CCMP2087" /LENGTH=72 /DNA_ID=CAMNT_0043893289 /DNA_START=114 /DNA_END=332 /DNA_ORIENTATION=-
MTWKNGSMCCMMAYVARLAKYAQLVTAYARKSMKGRRFRRPTQFEMKGQWWSMSIMQVSHNRQWCVSGGFAV